MTTITNEQICGSIKSTTGDIALSGEIKVSKAGMLMSIANGQVYDNSDPGNLNKYIGSYAVNNDYMNPSVDNRSVSINITDVSKLAVVSTAVTAAITEIEAKYNKQP